MCPLIFHSPFVVFDVSGVWDKADAELRELYKDTIRRRVDAEVVALMNEAFALGVSVVPNLPVYVPGYSPYSGGL